MTVYTNALEVFFKLMNQTSHSWNYASLNPQEFERNNTSYICSDRTKQKKIGGIGSDYWVLINSAQSFQFWKFSRGSGWDIKKLLWVFYSLGKKYTLPYQPQSIFVSPSRKMKTSLDHSSLHHGNPESCKNSDSSGAITIIFILFALLWYQVNIFIQLILYAFACFNHFLHLRIIIWLQGWHPTGSTNPKIPCQEAWSCERDRGKHSYSYDLHDIWSKKNYFLQFWTHFFSYFCETKILYRFS